MKVYIGPYLRWVGPFQIAGLLKYVGVSEDRRSKIGEWLNNTWLKDVCEWIDERRQRTVRVRIDNYDVWSMDATLSVLVVPMLKMLQKTKHGAPYVDDADVPEHLRSTAATPLNEEQQNCGSVDDNHFKRWDWVINEMIWAWEQIEKGDEAGQFSKDKDPNKPSDEPGISFTEMMARTTYDFEAVKAHENRIQNGMCLFGKYLRGLWD
jgi:hypothetical protein